MIRWPRLDMALSVWRRNARVSAKLWRVALLPPFLDPLLFFVGFGFALGTYIPSIDGLPYRDFVAPAILASTVLWQASFSATFDFWWRIEEDGTHDNTLTTPIEAEDVVLGELLWSATRATINAVAFLAVIAALGFVHSAWALLLPPFLFLGGLAFAALGMAFSVYNPKLDYFAYYFTLVVNPLFSSAASSFHTTSCPTGPSSSAG